MNTHADKAPENKSQSVAAGVSQPQSGGTSLQFIDNRPETLTQRKLKEAADSSAQVSRMMGFQKMAEKSLQFKEIIPSQAANQSTPVVQRVKLKDIDINDDDLVKSTDEFRDYTTVGVAELRGGTLTEAEALEACRAYAASGYARPMIDFALQAVAHGDWDGTTLERVAGGTVWYHGNASGVHGGAGTSGRQGAAIWLSKNPLTAYGYAKPSTNILRYQPAGTLILARLTEVGNQIFGDEIERWSRIAGIHGVFSDHGDGLPEIIVFDVANVQYINTTTLENLTNG